MNINEIIAVYDGDTTITGNLRKLFPNVSFPHDRPNTQWLSDNNVYMIESKLFDSASEKSTKVEPYYESGHVYDNIVENKTVQEIDDDATLLLNDEKTAKKVLIDSIFYTKITDGFNFEGNNFRIDDFYFQLIVGGIGRFTNASSFNPIGYWWSASNTKITMTYTKVKEFFNAAFDYKLSLLDRQQNLYLLVNSSISVEEIEAIDHTLGWPSN